MTNIRHPEARAKRASKDAAEVATLPGPSPFEGRYRASKTRVNALVAASG